MSYGDNEGKNVNADDDYDDDSDIEKGENVNSDDDG